MKTRIVMLAGLMLSLAVHAHAEELTFNVVVSPSGYGLYWMEQLAVFEPAFNSSNLSFGPTDYYDDISMDLGRPEAPWQTIHANGYTAGGVPGLNTVIHMGGCTLTIQGGLIVSATTPGPFGSQSCP